jgi:hypothetical protein
MEWWNAGILEDWVFETAILAKCEIHPIDSAKLDCFL